MSLKAVTKSLLKKFFDPNVKTNMQLFQPGLPKEHGLYSELKQMLKPDKDSHTNEQFNIFSVSPADHRFALKLIKQYYLPEHVIVREKGMDLEEDKALDEFLYTILKQGNTFFAKTSDGSVAGFCVNTVCNPVDPINIKQYALYRQDIGTKNFLNFTAKVHEVPNLWNAFRVEQFYDIHMLSVLPKYRRQGLAVRLAERAVKNGFGMGLSLVRMNCINSFDHMIAERCKMQCVAQFPIHELNDNNDEFVKPNSVHNKKIRVYVTATGKAKDLVTLYRYNRMLDDVD